MELMIPPTTGWVAQWQNALHVMGSIPGLACSFSSYRVLGGDNRCVVEVRGPTQTIVSFCGTRIDRDDVLCLESPWAENPVQTHARHTDDFGSHESSLHRIPSTL